MITTTKKSGHVSHAARLSERFRGSARRREHQTIGIPRTITLEFQGYLLNSFKNGGLDRSKAGALWLSPVRIFTTTSANIDWRSFCIPIDDDTMSAPNGDIVILGAGIIGLSTAYYLTESGTTSAESIHLLDSSPELLHCASAFAGGFLAADCT